MMKKNYFLFFVLCHFFALLGQAQSVAVLHSIRASDNIDSVVYNYNSQNQLIACKNMIVDEEGTIFSIDSLSYDVAGNVTLLRTYQLMDTGWLLPCYVEYTYDAAGNRLTRTNYNNFGNGYEQQGVYNYTYEGNRLVHHEMSLTGTPFERADYTYENGNLTMIVYEMNDYWGGNNWEYSTKVTYEYDENDNLVRQENFRWLDGAWELSSYDTHTYDDNGNCIVYTRYVGGLISNRKSYAYSATLPKAAAVFPAHPEEGAKRVYTCTNLPLSYSQELADVNWNLQYFCDYIFCYSPALSVGVASFENDALRIFPNPTSERIVLHQPNLQRIELYNLSGARVYAKEVHGNSTTINVSSYGAGTYILRSYNGSTWSASKIVVQ